jgi:iron(III) transport system permease protein
VLALFSEPLTSALRAVPAKLALLLMGALVSLPVLALVAAVLQWDAVALGLLREMAATVLPEYAGTTLLLCVTVALGVGGAVVQLATSYRPAKKS